MSNFGLIIHLVVFQIFWKSNSNDIMKDQEQEDKKQPNRKMCLYSQIVQ